LATDISETRLRAAIEQLFGPLDDSTYAGMHQYFERVDLPGGSCLFRQGEAADGMYVLSSGRLKVLRRHTAERSEDWGEIVPGETVGEMALLTGEPRNADVIALRDSLLLRISSAGFEELVERHPRLLRHITKSIIERFRLRSKGSGTQTSIGNICLLGLSARGMGAVPDGFVAALEQALGAHGAVFCVGSHSCDAALGMPGVAQYTRRDGATYRRLNAWLEDLERRYRFVLYLPDPTDTEWTLRCLRQADQILLCAEAGRDLPNLQPWEEKYLQGPRKLSFAMQSLVLLHPPGTEAPSGTAAWLQARQLHGHHHLRSGHVPDFQRLARFLSGKAVGLVLSGGAAKGFAHIGVFRALEEAGIPVDFVGGTSIGAIMGALVARGWPGERIRDRCREVFKKNPTSDLNLVPRVSIFKGRKLEQLLRENFGGWYIEDCWLNFFCVSCNLTRNLPHVHHSGLLTDALRASISIPGVFPPYELNNELYVDGGVFDNMPVALMRRQGAGVLVAVDLQMHRPSQPEESDVYRKRKMPNLFFVIMESSMLSGRYHAAAHRQNVDYYFNPPLQGFSLIDWNKFDLIEDIGYRHARAVLKMS
jgi:NTE family protein